MSPPKKSVGFGPEPEDDLREHHDHLKQIEQTKKDNSPFHKVPPELNYLRKDQSGAPNRELQLPSLDNPLPKGSANRTTGDLRLLHVKNISSTNNQTEVNFDYPEFELPIPRHLVLIEVEQAGLGSFDLSKINKYYYNWSDTKIGLGYEFVGTIMDMGANVKDYSMAVGDKVFGCVHPDSRKGSLSTSLLLDLSKDFVFKIDEMMYEKLLTLDPVLNLGEKSPVHEDDERYGNPEGEGDGDGDGGDDDEQQLQQQQHPKHNFHKHVKKISELSYEEPLVPIAKTLLYPVLYCRAKQALKHLNNTESPRVLINGADTNLAMTIMQMLNSPSLYRFKELTLVLLVKEENYGRMERFVDMITSTNDSFKKYIEIISYDVVSEDIILPGEKMPINYKKPDYIALQVLDAIFKSAQTVNVENCQAYKLDLLVDIVGSHFLNKTSINIKKFDKLQFPLVEKLDNSSTLSKCLNGDVKEQFFIKLLKPKSKKSGFVAFCKFNLRESSYSIDKLIDYSTQAKEASMLNLFSKQWSHGIANSVLYYNYYDEINLKMSREWLVEGLNLLLKNEIKFAVNSFSDWRDNFKKIVSMLRKDEGKVIFELEKF